MLRSRISSDFEQRATFPLVDTDATRNLACNLRFHWELGSMGCLFVKTPSPYEKLA